MSELIPIVKERLVAAAARYENAQFIETDPIQFPHRYSAPSDIEISAFVSAWIAYGSRKVFLKVLDRLHTCMDDASGPYRYIMDRRYTDFKDDFTTLYRFYTNNDFFLLCNALRHVYDKYGSLEEMIVADSNSVSVESMLNSVSSHFEGIKGIPVMGSKSASKRMLMFFRWMVRVNSPVDFGLWKSISPKILLVPVDTHVFQEAWELGLTTRNTADLKTAHQITDCMSQIWPDDPARGDFALYGSGIDV